MTLQPNVSHLWSVRRIKALLFCSLMSPFGSVLVGFLISILCTSYIWSFEQEPLLGTVRWEYQTSVPLNCMVLIQYPNPCIWISPYTHVFFCKAVRVPPKKEIKSNAHLKQVIALLLIQACIFTSLSPPSLPPFILPSFLHTFLFPSSFLPFFLLLPFLPFSLLYLPPFLSVCLPFFPFF